MRGLGSLTVAVCGGAISLMMLSATPAGAQTILNPNFESPTNTAASTDTNCDDWTLNPAVGDDYTNPGQRCTFASPTPSGGTWSFWLQTFVASGSATQVVGGVTAGTSYTFGSEMAFEVPGYNNVTLANQASDPNSTNTGDLYSYLEVQYENTHGIPVGSPFITQIPAGSVTSAFHVYSPYSVSGVAPAGAFQALLTIGWANGGLDGNTGGQSAFATSTSFAPTAVPEPATLSLLAIGGLGLLGRRRAKSLV